MDDNNLKNKILLDIGCRLNFISGKLHKTIMQEIEAELEDYDISHRIDKRPLKNIDSFIDDVLVEFTVLKKKLFKPNKGEKKLVTLRQSLMYILHKHYGLSKVKIGLKLKRDRTTVLHGIKISIDHIRNRDKLYIKVYEKCLTKLYE